MDMGHHEMVRLGWSVKEMVVEWHVFVPVCVVPKVEVAMW